MGYAKRLQEEIEEQGWRSVGDKYACSECVADESLKEVIRYNAVRDTCDYCGRSGPGIAASVDVLLETIAESLQTEWEEPDGSYWDSEEGRFMVDTYSIEDVLWEVGDPISNKDLEADIAQAFVWDEWCERNPMVLSRDKALVYGWEDFRHEVVHVRRYLFLMDSKDANLWEYSDQIPPTRLLQELGKVLDEIDVTRVVPAGSRLFRARVHDDSLVEIGAASLGPPPFERAVVASRMSPAGIPMFYGALDRQTATGETIAHLHNVGDVSGLRISSGAFMTARELILLDLSQVPDVPSIFDEQRRHLRSATKFLMHFARTMSEPIAQDGREHIEYVPSQIVTEYFRHAYETPEGGRLSGILYSSAVNPGGVCCVLFLDDSACCDVTPGWREDRKRVLGLDTDSVSTSRLRVELVK